MKIMLTLWNIKLCKYKLYPSNMGNYFYDMIPAGELSQVKYIPTIPEFLSWIEEKWADKPATSDTLNTYTYKEFCARIARKRALLNTLGLEKGDNVAIFERTSIDAIEMFLAAASAGYVGILLPASLPAQAVIGCCMKFRVKVLAVREEFAGTVKDAPCKVILSSAMSDETAPAAVVDRNDRAAIFFTGGTTGAPKGAVLPHRALMRGAFNGIFAPGSQLGHHRMICLLPLSHVFGLIRSTLSAFYTGAEWFPAEDMKATIGKFPVIKPTLLVLVPGLCEILLGLVKMYGAQFLGGELKMIISGAANVAPSLISEFDRMGIQLLAGYGMTEGANLTTGNADVLTHPTSVGKIYDGQEMKLVDGEIWFRGDNTFLGYYGEPEKTKETLTEDGWIKTGDLGRIDEDGFIYITGRIKNLIILSNGENVSPEEIESPFYNYAEVRDVLVSEQDEGERKIIAIEILPRPQFAEGKSEAEIYEHFKKVVEEVNGNLPSTHRISRLTIRKEDFLRTGAMKVKRN